MSWDGIKRRNDDNGGELPETILARIDERVKNINDKLILLYTEFASHKIEDNKNFGVLYKWVWIGTGIVCGINSLILIIKH